MASADWLTQEELLAELDQAGIVLAERTLRFWVAKGVLATPVKKPFSGADGRVGYYPRTVLGLVPRILKLQEEGWKLRQIGPRLSEQPKPERAPRATQAPSGEAEELAQRYLQDLMTDTEARDRRRCFNSPGAAQNELRQVRHYLVARLERLVGRSTAVRATSAFLLSLDARDMKRLITRLKISSSLRRQTSAPEHESADRDSLAERIANADLSRLAQGVGEHAARLRKAAPSAAESSPILLRRATRCLETIENLLATSPLDSAALAKELEALDEIEGETVRNLSFLESGAS